MDKEKVRVVIRALVFSVLAACSVYQFTKGNTTTAFYLLAIIFVFK